MSSIERPALCRPIGRSTLSRGSSSLRRAIGHLPSQGGQAQFSPYGIVNFPVRLKRVSMIGDAEGKEARQSGFYLAVVVAIGPRQSTRGNKYLVEVDWTGDEPITRLAVAASSLELA